MNISEPFIRRPVMTTLLMAALVIFGAFGYSTLAGQRTAERRFPDHQRVGKPARRRSGHDGVGRRDAAGKPVLDHRRRQLDDVAEHAGLDVDHHPVRSRPQHRCARREDVQAAIQAASRQLPTNMPSPPTLRKVNPSDAPIMYIAMQSRLDADVSKWTNMPRTCWRGSFRRSNGVAQVNVYGSQIYAVRIQADPSALAARGIGIDQVAAAVQGANVNVATGTLNGPTQSTLIHANGQLEDAAALQQPDHRLSQRRAGAHSGTSAAPSTAWRTTAPPAGSTASAPSCLPIQRQPGSNTIEIVNEINAVIPHFMRSAAEIGHAEHHLRPQPVDPRFGRRRADDAADRGGAGGRA